MMLPSITFGLRQLENRLAMRIVTGECPDGSRVRVQVREGQITFEFGG